MASEHDKAALTGSLEDYLETIYLLLRDRRVARVRDIAKARDVKAGSVTPALKRLAELGLIEYAQREYIDLTAAGEEAARRVFARHQLLTRFFHEVLQMSAEAADAEACKLEHSLSNEGMDRLVRFFEFLAVCPHRPPALLEAFHDCNLVHGDGPSCTPDCQLLPHTPVPAQQAAGGAGDTTEAPPGGARASGERARSPRGVASRRRSVYDLKPGQAAQITHVQARGELRRRLLDLGLLPDVAVEVLRVAPGGSPIWIKIGAGELELRKAEAKAVLVTSP